MQTFSSLLLLCLTIYCTQTVSMLSANSGPFSINSNGKSNDDLMCKTDDGRFEIAINSKIRLGANPCKVCTCTSTGFSCEDVCETIPASTSTNIQSEFTTTTTTTQSSILSSTTQWTLLSSLLTSSTSNISSNALNGFNSTASTSLVNNGNDNIASEPCNLKSRQESSLTREYAFVDCSEVYLAGKRTSGIYEIWPRLSPKPFRVFCDMETDGGGWTVIQRRGDYNQQVNFNVGWVSYKRGFGDLTHSFWLGNDKIYALTNQDEYHLHINITDFNDQGRFIEYDWFSIGNEQVKYLLNLGRYISPPSNGGDSLSYNRGMRFTTRDQDNDHSPSAQCAENYKSGWWHGACTMANLNGLYLRGNDSTATGIFWQYWLGARYSLKTCDMKIRPTGFNAEMLS